MITLEQLLVLHEGMRCKPYKDTKGILTIGVGRNLEANGLSEDEVLYLLQNDLQRCKKELQKALVYFNKLSQTRQMVLIDMCFNLGITKLLHFKKMLAHLQNGDYKAAAKEMRNSKWFVEVGERGKRLATAMETDILSTPSKIIYKCD